MWEDIAFANYIVGFSEADATFSISVNKKPNYKFGFQVRPIWALEQVGNEELLERIREFLGIECRVCHRKHRTLKDGYKRRDSTALRIEGTACMKLVEFFERFPLRGAKQKEFEFWKRAVQIYAAHPRSKRHFWTKDEVAAILEIKIQMDKTLMRPKGKPKGAIQALQMLESMS